MTTEKNNEKHVAEILQFVSVEDLLKADISTLSSAKKGVFHSNKIGAIAFTALDWADVGRIKKLCVKVIQKGSKTSVDVDDSRMMLLYILAAVDKDDRSPFTFYSKPLLERFQVVKAEDLVPILLSPGEIQKFAADIQLASDMTQKDEEDETEKGKDEDQDNLAKN